jgi:aryl-alcohol dehydrogenase-like predicted oxidoreductase
MISGWAKAESTAAYLTRFKNVYEPVAFGKTGLSVSPVGFGTYRVTQHDPEHREALALALKSGVNLIDTSTNYMHGSSERLIGDILAELVGKGEIKREEIVVVSKIGYVQGPNLDEARARADAGNAYPDMVEYDESCWHNISPEYIEEQLTQSLNRLGLQTLDVCLLHNPEYYLHTSTDRTEYEARIKKAFEHLEKEVERKRIRYYGISSNTFPEPSNKQEFTSLDRCWEMAVDIKKAHHFAVIQFPLNVFESGAAVNENNSGKTLLERAQELKLATLTNRPFNAGHRGRLVRLTSFSTHDSVDVKGRLHSVMSQVIELENNIPNERLKQNLNWGHLLRDKLGEITDLMQWRELLRMQIPQLHQTLTRVEQQSPGWAREYRLHVSDFLELITMMLENLADEKSQILAQQVVTHAKTLEGPSPLSNKVLRVYRGLSGVNCILVGMRSKKYVLDVLSHSLAPIPEEQSLEVMKEMHHLP